MKSAITIAISVAAISGTSSTSSSPQRKRTRQNNVKQSDETYEWGRRVGPTHSDVYAEEQQQVEKNARNLQGSMVDNPPLELPSPSAAPVPVPATKVPTYWPTYSPSASPTMSAASISGSNVVAATLLLGAAGVWANMN